MDGSPTVRTQYSSLCGVLRALWLLILLALTAAQTWSTLGLFGVEPVQALANDQPILAGRHPLHLYHAALGSRSFREHWKMCAFDPSFQAGYPKTPVFDAGSRPAELFLLMTGGGYRPAAYKIGLAVCLSLIPMFLAVAARGAGLGPAGAVISAAAGIPLCWSTPWREAIDAGDLDIVLGSIAAAVHIGMLLAYHRNPCITTWFGVMISGTLGVFAQPMLFLLLMPVILIYYLSVGHQHRPGWHCGLGGALGIALVANWFWLSDWVHYWWVRAPLPVGIPELSHRTFQTIWNASFWGDAADRALESCLFAATPLGLAFFQRAGQRCSARVLGLAFLGSLLSAIAGIGWEPLGRLGTRYLLLSALLFAVPIAVHGVLQSLQLVACVTGRRWPAVVAGACLAVAALIAGESHLGAYVARWSSPTPLPLGLGAERERLVNELTERTTPTARILWEDRPGTRRAEHWTALLPVLTGRAFLGGLDAETTIEHGYACMRDQMLAGRPFAEWSDVELDDFCRRYNIGWVACWSSAGITRFQSWSAVTPLCPLADEGPGVLFAIQREHSFALNGQAQWLDADTEHIVLGDLVPEDGKVVLSLHYQAGMQASPSRVHVEREIDPFDPIPFVRLKVSGPVARATLTWDKRR